MISDSKRIIIVGPGASGKDTLKARFVEKGFTPSISYTTRPIRDGEVDGVHYRFVSKEIFQFMIDTDQFYEWKEYGSEHGLDAMYGTSKKDFYASEVFIMTPSGIDDLLPDDRNTSMIIYLNVDESIRRDRLSKRNDFDTVDNRIERDNKHFANFSNYDLEIKNTNF